MQTSWLRRWLELLAGIYGEPAATQLLPQLRALADAHAARRPRTAGEITERDAMLITYADQLREDGKTPLRALGEFCGRRLDGLVTCMHLLPFFPAS